MTQPLIEVYRIKVLLSITLLSYLLIKNIDSIITCDIWIIGLVRIVHRLPWIFPTLLIKKNQEIYEVCSIPFSILLHITLLIRKTDEYCQYCDLNADLEFTIYFETYMALTLYFIFIIMAGVSQIHYTRIVNRRIKLESIKYSLINKWNQTDRMCCICYDDFIETDNIAIIKCGHYDHLNCMDEWISKSPSCPRCKQNIY